MTMEKRAFATALMVGCFQLLLLTTRVWADEFANADVRKLLNTYCSACHGDGSNDGGFELEELSAIQTTVKGSPTKEEIEKWYKVLRKVQSGSMPPAGEMRPDTKQIRDLVDWIKVSAFDINRENPDPGHVTMRRLNQVEYRNSVYDLVGFRYDTTSKFPADDTGHGFDNIGDVLSLSPLLLEKYVNAAEEIVSSVVPNVAGIVRQATIQGDQFELVQPAANPETSSNQPSANQEAVRPRPTGRPGSRGLELSYYQPASASAQFEVEHAGEYTLRLNFSANETYVDNQFDENQCELTFSVNGQLLSKETLVRQGGKDYSFEFPMSLTTGKQSLLVAVKPLTTSPQIRQLRVLVKSVDFVGPHDQAFFVKPGRYEEFFPRNVPASAKDKRAYASTLLEDFATRAFRRPVDEDSLNRLVDLAESVYSNGATFESGVAKSMTAVLASPRFLFREESTATLSSDTYPLIDEYSLASRLSYFLWSTMPDRELMDLARTGQLRENLEQQIGRMLKDVRSRSLSENFVGQWLRAREVDHIQINAPVVLGREPRRVDPESDVGRKRFFELFRLGKRRTELENSEYEVEKDRYLKSFSNPSRTELTSELRSSMRRETEMVFEYILQNDRSLLELIDSDYTFLNQDLASHYQILGLEPIFGNEMRLVQLPADSHRGGILTQGTTLVVTSNPDRTSPVKRGLFILENLLGAPPAAPPPNIPALEDIATDKSKPLSLRETLALHRSNALCSSCHNQMDPLGLALENFNALGRFRLSELNQSIDSSGTLTSGENFSSVEELKKILVTRYQTEIYRCIAEKLMTYALGRSVEYGDSHTIDELVSEMTKSNGSLQSLVRGIIRSNAFQRTRKSTAQNAAG